MALNRSPEPSRSAIPRRRPPPRLRTKTGCLTCRARRKKCDESRPNCVACARNRIPCKWTEHGLNEEDSKSSADCHSPASSETSSTLSVSTVEASDGPEDLFERGSPFKAPVRQLAKLSLAAFGLQSTQEADLLRHVLQNLVPTLVSSHAHHGFSQQGILSASSEPRPLLEALLALSSIYLSSKKTYYDEQAVGYYSKSMHKLRLQVASKSLKGSEDNLLMNVVWLYMFEIWAMRLDHLTGAAPHIKGALQILKLRQRSSLATFSPRAMDRLVAESSLYHLANMAFFDPTLLTLQVSELRTILEPLLSRPSFPDSTSLANFPVLAVPAELYFLVFEVSQLSHYAPLNFTYQARGMQIITALNQLKTHEDAWPATALEIDDTGRMVYDSAYLYVLAAKTLLFQLLNPQRPHTDPTIQAFVCQAMSILRTGVMAEPCKQFFCWPLLILSTVLENSDDIAFVHHELLMSWEISKCGNVLVVLQVFEGLTRRRTVGEVVDTLQFLRHLQGGMEDNNISGVNDRIFELV